MVLVCDVPQGGLCSWEVGDTWWLLWGSGVGTAAPQGPGLARWSFAFQPWSPKGELTADSHVILKAGLSPIPLPWNAAVQGASCSGVIVPKRRYLVVGNSMCKFSFV